MPAVKENKKLLGVLPDDDILSKCIHCGMCLSTCPTYELTKIERSSPRGRIKLIKSVARGEMEISPIFADEMSFCLDCQACETACPAGVKYGSMVEAARVEIEGAGYTTFFGRLIKRFTLRYLFLDLSRLNIAARLLYFYQNSLRKLLVRIKFFKLFPKLGRMDSLSPAISKHFSTSLIKEFTIPEEEKYSAAFLTGCLMNVMFAEINKDTVDALQAAGTKVVTPKNQVCCGSLHAHNGDMAAALKLAKQNIDIFSRYNYDFLIANSAGCGAFMKEYGHLLKDDKVYSEKASLFSSKVKDLTEFFYQIIDGIKFTSLKESITYHDACHAVHTQKIFNEPREILNRIPGLDIIPLEESTWCCGSAGIYNITRYEDSMKILERKMVNIKNTGAGVVLTANPGCIGQLRYGAEKFGVNIKVEHPVTLIKRAISKSILPNYQDYQD